MKAFDTTKDYFRVLGLAYGATNDEIKKAYKELALKLHPDKNQDKAEEAQAKFMEVQEAFELLSDPESKAVIDEALKPKVQKAKMVDDMDRKRKQREFDELEKERAAKFRDCLYYCPEERNFRTSLGPIKMTQSIFTSVDTMRDFAASVEAKRGGDKE
mmetsp:Transcript_11680/g.32533  ORF Transcript_11680/g.32533 Transcript_11680/m.32533 type:complete len:158 (+) Transcript_11680:338-811(+)